MDIPRFVNYFVGHTKFYSLDIHCFVKPLTSPRLFALHRIKVFTSFIDDDIPCFVVSLLLLRGVLIDANYLSRQDGGKGEVFPATIRKNSSIAFTSQNDYKR